MSRLMTKPAKWLSPSENSDRPDWSESSLCTKWVAEDSSFLHANSKDSDQTGQMPRMIWVFALHTCHFVGFVMRQLLSIWYCVYHESKGADQTADAAADLHRCCSYIALTGFVMMWLIRKSVWKRQIDETWLFAGWACHNLHEKHTWWPKPAFIFFYKIWIVFCSKLMFILLQEGCKGFLSP